MWLLLIFEVDVARVFLIVLDMMAFPSVERCANVLPPFNYIRKRVGIDLCCSRTFLVYLFIRFVHISYGGS
jgi:hypothetical protein